MPRATGRTKPYPFDVAGVIGIACIALLLAVTPPAVSAPVSGPAPAPLIRLDPSNQVSACVTPDRLMAFLKERNPRLDPRFADIARWYQHYGEGWRVRWDYAFFQMAIETNFLTFRRPDGRMGDVDPRQNNFAGIGTTGGGVPGDRFPDVKTGVLAQIQHLVAYSGERLAEPVAPRTRLKQDHIITLSQKLGRPVRFSDLARRWAVDPKYASSIEWVATQFRQRYCSHPEPSAAPKSQRQTTATPPAPRPAVRPVTRPAPAANIARPVPVLETLRQSEDGGSAPRCVIRTARYGGRKTILIRKDEPGAVELTALTVLEGFERSMTERFIAERAPGAKALGEFHDEEAALVKARTICPAA